jgi:excisionase family DNA binding protein
VTQVLFYTTGEVATFLRISERTAKDLAEQGHLPGAFKVGRQWRFNRYKLEEHVGSKLPEPQGEVTQ